MNSDIPVHVISIHTKSKRELKIEELELLSTTEKLTKVISKINEMQVN